MESDRRGRQEIGGGQETFWEARRRQREENGVNIWPPSPPRRDVSPDQKRKKRSKSVSSDSSSKSEEEHRKRKKKSSRSSKKSKNKKKKKRKRESSSSSSSDSDAEESAVKLKPKDLSEEPDQVPHASNQAVVDSMDVWQEKPNVNMDDGFVGPVPMPEQDTKLSERAYGGSLLAGEGSAMAAYLQSGKRIPRRGEIGLTSTEIENFEEVGYVMSGSRHQRMNAVRIRKENQVISAEEKNALLLFNQQEKARKEAETIARFKEMVAARLKKPGDEL
ncbi:hypothetical protein HDU97_006685 [Phlyctochytrium planicorne]|nr:hypothetical protein HDU97_006685 [Phlyctochytrium planicorne]